MASMVVKITGRFDPEADIVREIMHAARGQYALAETTATLAREQAPVITGFLRSTVYTTEPAWHGTTVVCTVGAWAHYAKHTEYRSSRPGWFSTAVHAVAKDADQRLGRWMALPH